jgi:hypothetical protein
MSAETIEWLNANSLIGNTDLRGNAWHWREGANNHFPGPVPRERVMQLFDFPVAEGAAAAVVPVINDDGVETKVFLAPGHKSIVRLDTGKVFNFPKTGYQMHPYPEWLVENQELLLDDGALDIGSAIVLKEGAVAAVQVEMPETRVANGRHTRGSLNQILEVRERLGIVVEQAGDAFDAQVRELTEKYVTDQKFYDIVSGFSGLTTAKEGRGKTIATNKAAALITLWHNDQRVAPWKNNAYGVLAAFNTFQHHIAGADKTRVERNELRTLEGKWDEFDAGILRMLEPV